MPRTLWRRVGRALLWTGVLALAGVLVALWHLSSLLDEHVPGHARRPPAMSGTMPIGLQVDKMSLVIPANYFSSVEAFQAAIKSARWLSLRTRYPQFDGFSPDWVGASSTQGNTGNERILININRSNRAPEDLREHLRTYLPEERQKLRKPHRIERVADRADLPGFAIYQTYFGNDARETLYEIQSGTDPVMAQCDDHLRPVPGFVVPLCTVTFHWRGSVYVKYRFQLALRPHLRAVHQGVAQLVESFVSTEEAARAAMRMQAQREAERERRETSLLAALLLFIISAAGLSVLRGRHASSSGWRAAWAVLARQRAPRTRIAVILAITGVIGSVLVIAAILST